MPPITKPYMEPSPKRIRVLFAGRYIVDTRQAILVWEKWYPNYFFPVSELSPSYLRESSQGNIETGQKVYDLVVRDFEAKNAVTEFTGGGDVRDEWVGLLRVTFSAVDAWFEEDERIYVHPKDPYQRVDVLQSSRHVRVVLNGVELANTTRPRLLFETSLRVRTYIPVTDVRVDLLRPSNTTSECPYKGVANYFDVVLPNEEVHNDIVWYYRTPQPECGEIKGFLAFYDEKVEVWVDDEKQL